MQWTPYELSASADQENPAGQKFYDEFVEHAYAHVRDTKPLNDRSCCCLILSNRGLRPVRTSMSSFPQPQIGRLTLWDVWVTIQLFCVKLISLLYRAY